MDKLYMDVDGNNIYEINNGTGKIKEYNISSTIKFEGEYLKGEKNGKGKQYHQGKLIFEGEYLNGEKNGKGKQYDEDKLIFEGEY